MGARSPFSSEAAGIVKILSYSLGEAGFILLVMLVPLLVAVFWPSATFLLVLAKFFGSMLAGFCLWLLLIVVSVRLYERKERIERVKGGEH
jgi:hypothetical protein